MDLHAVQSYPPPPHPRRTCPPWQPGDVLLAGGTALFSEPQPRVRAAWWTSTRCNGPRWNGARQGVRIAATCSLAELMAARLARGLDRRTHPRRAAEALSASFKVRHAATVGGNLCWALAGGAHAGGAGGAGRHRPAVVLDSRG